MTKIKYYINLSVINLIRNKKSNIKNILIMACSFMLFIMTFSISGSLNNFINNYILNIIERSAIMIDYEEDNLEVITKQLESNDKIMEFYEYQMPIGGDIKNYNELSKVNKHDMLLLKSGFCSKTPSILSGRIFNENEKNVGIIPKKFDPSGEIGISFEKETKRYLDGEQFLGKTITLEFKNSDNTKYKPVEYSFKVIGIYDSISNMDYPSDIYIPYKDMKYLNEQNELIVQEDIEVNNSVRTLISLVDKQENVNSVLNELRFNNLYAYKKAEDGLLENLSKLIIKIGTIISIVIFIISIINISLNSISDIQKRQQEISMLKVFGYKDSYIIMIIFIEILIISVISVLISALICKISLLCFDQFLNIKLSAYMSSLYMDVNLNSIVVGIIIMIINVLVISLINVKLIVGINPINIIKNKN